MVMYGKYDGVMRWITLILWLILGPFTMIDGGGTVSAWRYGCAWFTLVLYAIGDLVNYYKQHGGGR